MSGLKQTENLVLVNDSQAAIYAMMKLDTSTGKVQTDGHIRQIQIIAEKGDGVVLGNGAPISEVDSGISLGARQLGAVGATRLSWGFGEPFVETR